jgi:ABC-type multidrug transport system fused ATPase/permease subunit
LNRLRSFWHGSIIGRSLRVLSHNDQRKIVVVVILQIFMGILDLLGVVAIGLLGALSITSLQSAEPLERVTWALRFLHISNASLQIQILVLGAGALLFLVGRTILSIYFTRKVLFFLSRRGAKISSNLVSRLLSQSLLKVQERSTQETLFAVTTGVGVITLGVLAAGIVLISDVSLLAVLMVGLFVIDPVTAFATFAVFVLVGILLYRNMHERASSFGITSSELNIKSSEKIVEVFGSYRESVVRNRREFYAREIGNIRLVLADISAEISFMPYVSKYVIETTVIIGALLLGGVQFMLQDAAHAVATLAIFLAAGTRMAPAVLRIQQGSITILTAIGQANPTLDLIDSLEGVPLVEESNDEIDFEHQGFNAEVEITDISLTYPKKDVKAISNVTLRIPKGSSVALVGPTGAGKTTLVDVLLGVFKPDEGSVLISTLPPLQAITNWPGAISYVPQDVMIAAGSIRENVALGYPSELATDELVMSALKIAQLDEFVAQLPMGAETQVGERGTKISGGQRQRLGIARAMFTKPHLLVLDEATSALDGTTEAGISEAIYALRGSTTVVMIAHRLSTVRDADIVVYMSEGKVLATGSFEQVRASVPDFDQQAKVMGL